MRILGLAGRLALAAMMVVVAPAMAQNIDAVRFGSRESVESISLSPDGSKVVFLTPGRATDSILFVADVASGEATRILSSDGKPDALNYCRWASNSRIVCQILAFVSQDAAWVGYTRMFSIGADGKNAVMLSPRTTSRALGVAQGGGQVIDWLPDADGMVIMTRNFVPEASTGTHIAEGRQGYGVERIDTANGRRTTIEQPNEAAVEYITDGYGAVRIMGTMEMTGNAYVTGTIRYSYRTADDRSWKPLSTLSVDGTGFNPYAVDRDLNVVYGFENLNGRSALYRISLDGTMKRELVHARDDVDVDDLIRIGRRQRVVGVGWVTDRRQAMFFDPALKTLAASLSKALPGLPLIRFIDASADENRLLLWAGSDNDPGRYYVFDRKTKQLLEIMLSRPQLENVPLATVKPITFKAADGTMIPGYLTLPAGSDGKNLPAIVMPHGGPGARDEWGFDWLSQYFAARGYAVLQPNFRGSTGYGDAWFVENGFKSWRTAVGDVNDGGRWLVAQGIADPAKMAIVGWSYGGYAALQSSMLDPNLFKAVIAIAPVTDLSMLKQESIGFTNYRVMSDFIGTGPHIAEGSPARHAAEIRAPVLLFHGDRDANVGVAESRLMAERLRAAGKRVDYVEFPGLDHQLADSAVRIGMLDKSDLFLRASMGIGPRP